MKYWLLQLFLCWAAPLLLAAGSSGDYLYTPGNEAITTKQFGSGSDTLDRGGWLFEDSKGYARPNGVSLPREGKGVLCYTFPEGESPQRVEIVTVKCSVAASGNANKACSLTVALAGTSLEQSYSFSVPAVQTQVTMTFRFEEIAEATGLRLSNSGSTLFEVAEVEWADQLPEMEVDLAVTSMCVVGGTITYSINGISGGSGVYTGASVMFNGEKHLFEGEFPWSGTFSAPSSSGVYPLTVIADDDEGNEGVATREIEVVPYATPVALTASNITRDGFDLSWELAGGATPSYYTAEVTLDPRQLEKEVVVAPTWVLREEGVWETQTPVDLQQYSGGFDILSGTVTFSDAVSRLKLKAESEDTWETRTSFNEVFVLGKWDVARQKVMLQVTAAEAPRYLVMKVVIGQILVQQKVTADAQRSEMTFTGLPSGKRMLCSITVHYVTEAGETKSKVSEPYAVQTLALPGFASAKVYTKWKCLQLSWPEGESNLSGKVTFYALKSVENLVPKGLYLTRVLYTQKEKTGKTSKAIAITNTSNRPIQLNGNYKLKAKRKETGTLRTWDFSVTDDTNNKHYPYVIAPGAELVFAHGDSLPVDTREEVCTTTSSAMNFTEAWELSLWCGETEQNRLEPQSNALVRLEEDSLEAITKTEIDTTTETLDELYAPWTKVEEVKVLGSHTIRQGASAVQVTIGSYLKMTDQTRRIWAECVTIQGENESAPLTVIVWEAPVATGFQLRIR